MDPRRIPPVGHRRLDSMHAALAEQANAVYEAWQRAESGRVVVDGLARLIRLTGRHFAEEETIAAAAGYADLERHAARHSTLLGELQALHADLAAAALTGSGQAIGRAQFIDALRAVDTLLYEHESLDDQDYWQVLSDDGPSPDGDGPLIAPGDLPPVGLAEIDRQHQDLAELVNRLYAALTGGAPPPVCEALLAALIDHTRAHFAFEESMMTTGNPAMAEAHRLLHADLLAELGAAVDKWRAGGYVGLEVVLATYLKYWLIDHIGHVDPGLGAAAATAPE